MIKIKSIINQNKPAIIFFTIILFGVFSFTDGRSQEIKNIKAMENTINGAFTLIEDDYSSLSVKTLVSKDEAADYQKIIEETDTLVKKVNTIKTTVPAKGNKNEAFDNVVNGLNIFLDDVNNSLETIQNKYEKDLELLPEKSKYFKFTENIESVEAQEALNLLEKITLTEIWYYAPEQKNNDNYYQKSLALLDEINTLKSEQADLDNTKVAQLYNKAGYFSIVKKFRISQQNDLKDKEYYEKLDSLIQDLDILKEKYSLNKSQG